MIVKPKGNAVIDAGEWICYRKGGASQKAMHNKANRQTVNPESIRGQMLKTPAPTIRF